MSTSFQLATSIAILAYSERKRELVHLEKVFVANHHTRIAEEPDMMSFRPQQDRNTRNIMLRLRVHSGY